MPAAVIERPPLRSEAMWLALKIHIQKERQKKKQEQEADAEVERQRKERERQQKQDVMTLGETREQISQLEQRLAQLKEEKHQLFLQLKKVLNEDDNRRRQLVKESNEVLEMYGVTLGSNPQLFLQQNAMPMANRNPMYKVPPTHTLLPPGALKRPCSPSPPPPAANYHQNYSYKPGQAVYQKVATEDNRRGHEYVRAVLWNKNSQYSPFYPTSTTISYSASASPSNVQTVYTYAGPQFAQPSGAQAPPPPPTREAPPPPMPPQDSQAAGKHPVYMGQPRPPPISQGFLHSSMEHSKGGYSEDKFYSVAPIRPATHVSLHGGAIPIQQPPQGAKTGGITSGYPIRPPTAAPPPQHVNTSNSASHGGYVSQQPPPSAASRLVYSQAGIPPPTAPPGRYAPMSNMQREV